MMQLIRITDSDDAFLKRLISLYEESFPLEERRPVEQLKRLIKSADSMHFNAVVLDGELCGLFVFWDFETFYYLEHFAISKAYFRLSGKAALPFRCSYTNSGRTTGFRLCGKESFGIEIA